MENRKGKREQQQGIQSDRGRNGDGIVFMEVQRHANNARRRLATTLIDWGERDE